MAFEKGTASNFADLFDKFVSFLTTNPDLVAKGQAHELVFRSKPTGWDGRVTTSVQREHAVFKGPGLAGEDEIFTSITTHGDTALDYYNWGIAGCTGFKPTALGQNYANLRNGMTGPSTYVGCLLWNQPMPYWFFANGRRWWVVVKVSTIYSSCGAGFILPSVAPSEFPYPLAVFGSYPDSTDRWSSTANSHRGLTSPYNRQCYLRTPNGSWADWYSNGYTNWEVNDPSNRRLLPVGVDMSESNQRYYNVVNMRDSPGAKFPLIPVTFISLGSFGQANYGEADGLFFIPTLNNGAEDTIVRDGVTYYIFQSAFRSGSPYLFALRAD